MARGDLRSTGDDGGGSHAEPEAVLTTAQGPLRIKAVHPVPPISDSSAYEWREELRALPGPAAGTVPRVLVGDFNATLDQRELRRLLDRGFYDAADATGDGLALTWPNLDRGPFITIDHVLLPEAIRVRDVAVYDVAGSDHRALVATLVLPG